MLFVVRNVMFVVRCSCVVVCGLWVFAVFVISLLLVVRCSVFNVWCLKFVV